MQTLTQIPDQIEAGTSVEYTRSYTDFPANGGWTLKLHLKGAGAVDKDAVAVGKDFKVTLTALETAGLVAGDYEWRERVTDGTQVLTAAEGRLEILPDIGAAAAGAIQSWEEKALAMVEKVIAYKSGAGVTSGRLSADILEYEIAGRRVVKHDLLELLRIRDSLKSRIRARLHPGQLEVPVRVYYSGGMRP